MAAASSAPMERCRRAPGARRRQAAMWGDFLELGDADALEAMRRSPRAMALILRNQTAERGADPHSSRCSRGRGERCFRSS